MWSPFGSQTKYQALKGDVDVELDSTESLPLENDTAVRKTKRRRSIILSTALIITALAAITAFSITKSQNAKPKFQSEPSSSTNTTKCSLRREWRTLTVPEKAHYITSVKCLLTLPSRLGPSSHSLYEDFPWIHSHIGYYTHNSAPFLPWHRYFLHIYETALREQCNYTGALVYWDWSLDWEHLEKAPVFDADTETGFGTDGEVDGAKTVGNTGRCVVDGAFSGIKPSYYHVKYQPHCLSRGFRDDEGHFGTMDGRTISPESIDEVLSLERYEDFVKVMEAKVHDAIPFGIGGDFETFTAPYDPLFYLHHTQLDRIWWLWQQRKPEERMDAYGGHAQRHSIEMASLTDAIKMGALAPEIQVGEVMSTESDSLCYRYE